jgi:hypothetical protein
VRQLSELFTAPGILRFRIVNSVKAVTFITAQFSSSKRLLFHCQIEKVKFNFKIVVPYFGVPSPPPPFIVDIFLLLPPTTCLLLLDVNF